MFRFAWKPDSPEEHEAVNNAATGRSKIRVFMMIEVGEYEKFLSHLFRKTRKILHLAFKA